MRYLSGIHGGIQAERALRPVLDGMDSKLTRRIELIDDLVSPVPDPPARPRVLLFAANDTHAHFLTPVAEALGDGLFAVPNPRKFDENAAGALRAEGFDTVEIDADLELDGRVDAFDPHLVLCGNDWSAEFRALRRYCRRRAIPTVALQEGPQDWEAKWGGINPRKYQNADVLFATGPVTFRSIQPKHFAITGNPKVDRLEARPLPDRPRVLINCNFTYGQYEEARAGWMRDVLGACRELGLDCVISRHPRDPTPWEEAPTIHSNAYRVRDQLSDCSIVVSRFSSIIYEALALGRPAIYYNPHGEPMTTFNDERNPAVCKARSRAQLKKTLREHSRRMAFDPEAALECLRTHCGPMRGKSARTIAAVVREMVAHRMAPSTSRYTPSAVLH